MVPFSRIKKENEIMEAEATTHLSESGQVNIPTAIREFLQWRSGLELEIRITSSGLLIHPKYSQQTKRRFEDLRGFFKHQGKPLSNEELCAPVDLREPE